MISLSNHNINNKTSGNNSNKTEENSDESLNTTISNDSAPSAEAYASIRNTNFLIEQSNRNSNKRRKMSANCNSGNNSNKVNDMSSQSSPNAKYLSTYVSFPPQRFDEEEELDESFW